ncbi:hypothetical protein [Ktedonospora formicarum]|uniref:Nucleotidyltransferase n=1 Tax=Ktedonospora formicarum TaxID=2778364 RepID=A0A8J3I7Q1_9CHLR|nr:hypothetical protein [Ktedonospora formicarum]GHO46239.1 hypothetical protein KSX_44020 [Ktedonospora formicarum]
MERQEVELYLQELGDELERRGFEKPVRVMIVGGVYMLVMVGNRESTQDIDVVLMDMPDTTSLDTATKESRLFKTAVRAVARRLKIKQHWLNDDAALFVRGFAPDPQARHWKTFNRLEVYLPSKACILALKLISFREKDRGDVEALCTHLGVQTREEVQALVDTFIAKHWQEEYLLENTLDELFY